MWMCAPENMLFALSTFHYWPIHLCKLWMLVDMPLHYPWKLPFYPLSPPATLCYCKLIPLYSLICPPLVICNPAPKLSVQILNAEHRVMLCLPGDCSLIRGRFVALYWRFMHIFIPPLWGLIKWGHCVFVFEETLHVPLQLSLMSH